MLLNQPNRSEKQRAASRANGAKSRGPVTPEGKRNSANGAMRHGILARTVVLETESKDRFYELLNAFFATYRPVGPAETVLVQKMAVSHWRLLRLWSHQKAAFALELREQGTTLAVEDAPTRDSVAFGHLGGPNSPAPAIMDRYETTYDRQFARALRLLRWEQALRLRSQQLLENMEETIEPEPDKNPYFA
jgi:hypothetical protein